VTAIPCGNGPTVMSADYAVAYRHLANGTARVLIESRGRAPRHRSSRSGLSPVEALYILQEKWEPSP
jgi:tRNA A37 N6-isopentenylltransferase MiaA